MPRPDWPTAAPFVPDDLSLDALARAAEGCRGCPLWEPTPLQVPRLREAPDPRDEREAARAGLVADLRVAAKVLGG